MMFACSHYGMHAGRFEEIVCAPDEPYRPLAPKHLVAVYKKGSCFGGTNIIQGQPHQTTVVSSNFGTLGVIPKREYLVGLQCSSADHVLSQVVRAHMHTCCLGPDQESHHAVAQWLQWRALSNRTEEISVQ